ncbi:MAG: hypothetical protein KJ871_05280 [Alphaproteobacteria bacterium]|nr:hypothetical protein [Alphaproteobacteria bacterium]MBU2082506.1 hypothetical protein [Alphaproteobacteria bacterium]MBU2142854.1 hypothetical protein [Alphaproteobacteria bacterium]MBU2195276.1 hypothetical protein [Alphaproteobacteria bacterium]
MKRTLTATAAILAVLAMPAYAQVSGIDTTTTPSTDASIDIDPPSMETGADIMADGQPYPDDVLELESRNEVETDLPDLTVEQTADALAAAEANADVEAQGDADLEVETRTQSEFEPEPDIDIGSQLDLKIEDQ